MDLASEKSVIFTVALTKTQEFHASIRLVHLPPNVPITVLDAADDAIMMAPDAVKFICRSVLQKNIVRKPDMICQMDVSVTEALRHKTAFRIVVLSGIHMQMADVR